MRTFLFIIISFLVCSCVSNEDKAQKAFTKYVKENFDDPASFKEVVSVNIEDTLRVEELKKMVQDVKYWSDSLENYSKVLSDSLQTLIKLYDGAMFKKTEGFRDDWEDYISSIQEHSDELLSLLGMYLDGEISPLDTDSILALQDKVLYKVVVKYRVKENESLKLKTSVGLSDGDFDNTDFLLPEKGNKYANYLRISKTMDFYNKKIESSNKVLNKQLYLLDKIQNGL